MFNWFKSKEAVPLIALTTTHLSKDKLENIADTLTGSQYRKVTLIDGVDITLYQFVNGHWCKFD